MPDELDEREQAPMLGGLEARIVRLELELEDFNAAIDAAFPRDTDEESQ